MGWIVSNIKWIMVASGTLTFSMIYAAIDPEGALRSNFGETVEGPVGDLLTRNWGALIALVGGMLVYGAYDPPTRKVALTVAGLSKAVFIGLVLSNGSRFLSHQAGIAVVVDSVMILVFVAYLAKTRGR